MPKQIKLLVVRPGQEPKAEIQTAHADNFKKILGGFFSVFTLESTRFESILCYFAPCNQVYNGLLNRIIEKRMVYGTFLITKINDSGVDIDLTEDDIRSVTRYINSLDKNTNVH